MTTAQPTTSPLRPVLRRWPILAGLGFAAFVGLGTATGVDLAKVLAASAVMYIGAAALRRPAAGWPMFFATVVVITVADVADVGFDATWPLLGIGVLLAGYGLLRGARRPASGLPVQALALLGFGVVASLALFVDQTVGGYLVAAGLLGHSLWDAYHHKTAKVVARSLAEFCLVLDAALAVIIIVVTAAS